VIKLNSKTSVLRLATSTASNVKVSYAFKDTNKGTFKPFQIGGSILPPITVAGITEVVPAPSDFAVRQVTSIAMYNAGVDCILKLEEFDGVDVNERFNRNILSGEIAEFDDIQGWVIYDVTGLKKPAVA
jgi:hypothetical protein